MYNFRVKTEKNRRPFVFLCTGMSLDGKLSNYKKEQIQIATNDDKDMLYECRAKADAVVVGGHTLLQDDPKLTLKHSNGNETKPVKVGVVSDASDLNLKGDFLNVGNAQKLIFTTEQTPKEKIIQIETKALVCVLGKNLVNLSEALKILFDLGIKRLMVEGGGTLIYSLLEENLIDEIYLKIGNLIVGGKDSITFVEGKGFESLGVKKVKFLSIKRKPNYLILKVKPLY